MGFFPPELYFVYFLFSHEDLIFGWRYEVILMFLGTLKLYLTFDNQWALWPQVTSAQLDQRQWTDSIKPVAEQYLPKIS